MKTVLFVLVSFIAVTANLSGLLLISQPDCSILKLPLSLLEGTPFKTYLIPGVLLVVFVGIVNLLAVFFNLRSHQSRYDWAMAGGVSVVVWFLSQLILIQTVHWLHVAYFGIGLIIFLLAYQLKGKWIV